MVAVTYGGASVADPAVAGSKSGIKSKGIFARVLDAIVETQTKRAQREIMLHRHLLPPDFEFPRKSSDEPEPFGGW
jgi:hypothetical protein